MKAFKKEKNRIANRAIHEQIEGVFNTAHTSLIVLNPEGTLKAFNEKVAVLSSKSIGVEGISSAVEALRQEYLTIMTHYNAIKAAKEASDEAYCSERGGADDECAGHFSTVTSKKALFDPACAHFTATAEEVAKEIDALRLKAARAEAARVEAVQLEAVREAALRQARQKALDEITARTEALRTLVMELEIRTKVINEWLAANREGCIIDADGKSIASFKGRLKELDAMQLAMQDPSMKHEAFMSKFDQLKAILDDVQSGLQGALKALSIENMSAKTVEFAKVKQTF